MSVLLTNGASTLTFQNSHWQIPVKPPKRRTQRLINNTAKLPVVQTVSDATDKILTCELSIPRVAAGDYDGMDTLYSFFESDDPSGVAEMAQTFMLTDADGDSYQCRFIDDIGGGLRRTGKNYHYSGSVRLLVEHTLPTDEATAPIIWVAAYDPDNNGGDVSGWDDLDEIGGVTNGAWQDKSGNSNDASNTSFYPRWSDTTFPINSRPAVDFNGSDDFLLCDGVASTFDGASDTAWSAYAVFITDTDNAGQTILAVGTGASDAIAFIETKSGGVSGAYLTHIHDGSSNSDATGGVTDTSIHMVSVVCSGTAVSMWEDGTAIITNQTQDVGQIDVDRGRIGKRGAASTYFNGRIGEIVLFAEAHTTIQRRRQEFRLADMWNVTLSE